MSMQKQVHILLCKTSSKINKEVFTKTAGLDFKSDTFPYQQVGKMIVIHDNVWIGAGAIIIGGVEIGKKSND